MQTISGEPHEIDISLEGGETRYSFFDTDESTLKPLVDDLFSNHWSRIVVGPCLEGAVFEIQFEKAPAVKYLDGYLTVDLGKWHFHLCIGPTRSSKSLELCEKRPVAKAALFESRGMGHGRSWGLRFWNGFGEQMATVFLQNPNLSDEMKFLKQPDWTRLELYYQLRQRLLGEPIPSDYGKAASMTWPEEVE